MHALKDISLRHSESYYWCPPHVPGASITLRAFKNHPDLDVVLLLMWPLKLFKLKDLSLRHSESYYWCPPHVAGASITLRAFKNHPDLDVVLLLMWPLKLFKLSKSHFRTAISWKFMSETQNSSLDLCTSYNHACRCGLAFHIAKS